MSQRRPPRVSPATNLQTAGASPGAARRRNGPQFNGFGLLPSDFNPPAVAGGRAGDRAAAVRGGRRRGGPNGGYYGPRPVVRGWWGPTTTVPATAPAPVTRPTRGPGCWAEAERSHGCGSPRPELVLHRKGEHLLGLDPRPLPRRVRPARTRTQAPALGTYQSSMARRSSAPAGFAHLEELGPGRARFTASSSPGRWVALTAGRAARWRMPHRVPAGAEPETSRAGSSRRPGPPAGARTAGPRLAHGEQPHRPQPPGQPPRRTAGRSPVMMPRQVLNPRPAMAAGPGVAAGYRVLQASRASADYITAVRHS